MDHLQEAKICVQPNPPGKFAFQHGVLNALIAIAEQNNHSLLKTIGRLISEDMHGPSMRPCSTCRIISSIVGEPVGCYHFQKMRKEQEDKPNG